MRSFIIRIGVSAIAFMGSIATVAESHASGPVAIQQAVAQVQSTLTESSLGWRRCCHGRRFGYGFGYGFGYPYGYAGYGYARPVIYSYPAYSYVRYRPRYYSSYTYSSPCCGYSYSNYQPMTFGANNYSYPSQSAVYSPTVYTSPTYSTSVYSSPTVYTPSVSSPTVISAPTPSYSTPTSLSSPAPAPYPAPPVEYTQPSVRTSPVATSPLKMAYLEYQSRRIASPEPMNIAAPVYSTTTAHAGFPQHAAYSPATYVYPSAAMNQQLAGYYAPY